MNKNRIKLLVLPDRIVAIRKDEYEITFKVLEQDCVESESKWVHLLDHGKSGDRQTSTMVLDRIFEDIGE
jgi:hypothetical protein